MGSTIDGAGGFPSDSFAQYNADLVDKCTVLATSTILYFEYALTLEYEVAWVWAARPRITCSHLLFYLNRYMSPIGHVVFLLQVVWLAPDNPHKPQICMHLLRFHGYFAIMVQTIVVVFLAMRTYALYGQSKRVLAMIFVTAAVVFSVGVWSVATSEPDPSPLGVITVSSDFGTRGCSFLYPDRSAKRFAGVWAGLLALDLVIFILTAYKSIQYLRRGGSTLTKFLLWDGAMYFGIMAMLSSLTIIIFLAVNHYYRGIIVTGTNALSSVLMSRLFFNIRNPSLSPHLDHFIARSGTIYTEPIWANTNIQSNETDEDQTFGLHCPAHQSSGSRFQ